MANEVRLPSIGAHAPLVEQWLAVPSVGVVKRVVVQGKREENCNPQ